MVGFSFWSWITSVVSIHMVDICTIAKKMKCRQYSFATEVLGSLFFVLHTHTHTINLQIKWLAVFLFLCQ